MKKKVYIAHNFKARGWLLDVVVPQLETVGFEVTSRWLRTAKADAEGGDGFRGFSPANPYTTSAAKEAEFAAVYDLYDVRVADYLLYFASAFEGKAGIGKHVELGYALALHKTVSIIGRTEELVSIFHWDRFASRFQNFDEFVRYWKGR